MTTMTCAATRRYMMTTDAPSDDALIALADAMSLQRWGNGLDSLDLGDAMGAMMHFADEEIESGNEGIIAGDGFLVTITRNDDLFEWGG